MSALAGQYILTIICPDTTGIVAAVASYLRGRQCFIDQSFQYGDPATQRFFMRAVFTPGSHAQGIAAIEQGFAVIARDFAMDWSIVPADRKARVLIAVSKFGHCLNDLLHRWQTGQIPIDIVGVFSNHEDMRALVRSEEHTSELQSH